jgi:predicted RNA-binding Zn-ribbon protein involved in translation (DUF1610 family)
MSECHYCPNCGTQTPQPKKGETKNVLGLPAATANGLDVNTYLSVYVLVCPKCGFVEIYKLPVEA